MFDILWFLAGLELLIAGDGLLLVRSLLNFDLGVVVAVAFACLSIFFTRHRTARWTGGTFIGYYVADTACRILASRQHELLPRHSQVTLGFVMPLTIVTLIVMQQQPARP
jgi:cation:H+ antiporter